MLWENLWRQCTTCHVLGHHLRVWIQILSLGHYFLSGALVFSRLPILTHRNPFLACKSCIRFSDSITAHTSIISPPSSDSLHHHLLLQDWIWLLACLNNVFQLLYELLGCGSGLSMHLQGGMCLCGAKELIVTLEDVCTGRPMGLKCAV